MGAFHPTRVSFVRTLVRRMARERWRFERERFDLDADGYGDIVYRVVTPAGTLRFVAFSNRLDPSERTDRVIATRWDSTFVLTAAEVDDALLADYRKNIPLQEAGRCHPFDLVLSRANRSVRLFEHVVECLADGRQPAFAKLAEVGYLMRTTAVYGNGKFGVGDFEAVRAGGVFSLPFQAEMLTVYLARLLSFDLVEHIARARAPDRAVRLKPAVARCLGVGNATGLGMAPFLVTHPRLLDRWIHARELGLARVRAVAHAEPERIARLAVLVARAKRHVSQWRTDDKRQSDRIGRLAVELEWLSGWIERTVPAGTPAPWDAMMRAAESRGCVELEEMTLSLLLELYPELVDALEEDTGADERLDTRPAMRMHELAAARPTRLRLGARDRLRRSEGAAPVLVLLRGEGGAPARGAVRRAGGGARISAARGPGRAGAASRARCARSFVARPQRGGASARIAPVPTRGPAGAVPCRLRLRRDPGQRHRRSVPADRHAAVQAGDLRREQVRPEIGPLDPDHPLPGRTAARRAWPG